jgi:hypothetical protein
MTTRRWVTKLSRPCCDVWSRKRGSSVTLTSCGTFATQARAAGFDAQSVPAIGCLLVDQGTKSCLSSSCGPVEDGHPIMTCSDTPNRSSGFAIFGGRSGLFSLASLGAGRRHLTICGSFWDAGPPPDSSCGSGELGVEVVEESPPYVDDQPGLGLSKQLGIRVRHAPLVPNR